MDRPVPKDQITVDDAVRLILNTRMAEPHREIQDRFSLERLDWELQIPPEIEVDLTKLEFSRDLVDSFERLKDRARSLLRQWLRDGEIKAFYSDALSKDSVEIMAPAWGLSLTDRVIKGGDFNPYEDPKFAGPVGVLLSDLERVIGGKDGAASRLSSQQENCSIDVITAPVTASTAPRLFTRPTGRDRMIASVRIALQELYGPGMGREARPKERASAVVRWLRKQGWDEPAGPEKMIYNILNPKKRG